jgi:hypothetical protein
MKENPENVNDEAVECWTCRKAVRSLYTEFRGGTAAEHR